GRAPRHSQGSANHLHPRVARTRSGPARAPPNILAVPSVSPGTWREFLSIADRSYRPAGGRSRQSGGRGEPRERLALKPKRASPRTGQPPVRSSDQRAAALRQGTKSLLSGNRGDQLEVIPVALGFCRLLCLVEVNGMDLAPIDSDRALAVERIVSRKLLHLGDHEFAVAAVADRRHRLEIM